MIDTHSHILPGIDDGSKDIETSLNILRGLSEQGVTEVVLTPHYVAETSYTSSRAQNTKLLEMLQKKVTEENIQIKLHLGNEIYIDKDIAGLIRRRKISPMGNTRYLLVELPMSGEFESYQDILKSLIESGWKIILAHPERYHSFQKDTSKIDELHNIGILLQVNLGSIIEQYGKTAKKTAKYIFKNDMAFCFGTDIHHERDYSEIAKAQKKLRKYYSEDKLNQLLVENPQSILNFTI